MTPENQPAQAVEVRYFLYNGKALRRICPREGAADFDPDRGTWIEAFFGNLGACLNDKRYVETDEHGTPLESEPAPAPGGAEKKCFKCGHAWHSDPCVNVHPDLLEKPADSAAGVVTGMLRDSISELRRETGTHCNNHTYGEIVDELDVMDKKFRELEREARRLQWQPIATVPLGTDVLLHTPFEVGGASTLVHIGMIVRGNYEHGCTHWMPLPAAPALATEGAGVDDFAREMESERHAIAAQNAIESFCSGTHEVFGEDDDIVCRMVRVRDPGDSSVGLAAYEAWQLADDQSGTRIDELEREARRLREAISDFASNVRSSNIEGGGYIQHDASFQRMEVLATEGAGES